jgi:hypothetical protein
MQIFQFRNNVIGDYAKYIKSFISVADPQIQQEVEQSLASGLLWRDPLVQINPTFQGGATVEQLVNSGAIHPECGRVFRRDKRNTGGVGLPLNLHLHQEEAIHLSRAGKNYVLCTGTGSGKSLAYIIPIADHVLRSGSGRGISDLFSAIEWMEKRMSDPSRNIAFASIIWAGPTEGGAIVNTEIIIHPSCTTPVSRSGTFSQCLTGTARYLACSSI